MRPWGLVSNYYWMHFAVYTTAAKLLILSELLQLSKASGQSIPPLLTSSHSGSPIGEYICFTLLLCTYTSPSVSQVVFTLLIEQLGVEMVYCGMEIPLRTDIMNKCMMKKRAQDVNCMIQRKMEGGKYNKILNKRIERNSGIMSS